MTIASIAAYNYLKVKKMRRTAREEVKVAAAEREGQTAEEEGEREEQRAFIDGVGDERDERGADRERGDRPDPPR